MFKENYDITNLSNYKTPASARYFYEINFMSDVYQLNKVIAFAKKKNIPYLFIGGGTNLLFAFDTYEGIIIKCNLKGWMYSESSGILEAYASERISDISEILESDDDQNIWHRFIGLPGTIGGAVYGNAGCFGLETENNFNRAIVLNLETGKEEVLQKKDMKFTYRSSILKETNKYFLIKAIFDLSKKIEKYHSDVDNLDFRENKQPKGNTCGSFFKNPSKEYSAGRLIEEAGLKGHYEGGAYFSDIHANFLMHNGQGTYKDLLLLVKKAQKKVKKQFGIDLVPEVRIIHNT